MYFVSKKKTSLKDHNFNIKEIQHSESILPRSIMKHLLTKFWKMASKSKEYDNLST